MYPSSLQPKNKVLASVQCPLSLATETLGNCRDKRKVVFRGFGDCIKACVESSKLVKDNRSLKSKEIKELLKISKKTVDNSDWRSRLAPRQCGWYVSDRGRLALQSADPAVLILNLVYLH